MLECVSVVPTCWGRDSATSESPEGHWEIEILGLDLMGSDLVSLG